MKKTIMFAALAATMFVACNNSANDAQISMDVHRLVAKTEQCYANVHNDLLDSLDEEYFADCNNELQKMMDDIAAKYTNEKDRRKFDSLYMDEIQRSDIDNDLISMMEEIYGMNYDE